MSFLKFWIYLLILDIAHSFYISLSLSQIKCFNITVFKNQKLLIQLQTPILESDRKFIITVYNGQKTLLNQQLKNVTAKYNLPKDASVVNDQINPEMILEFKTCLSYISTNNISSKDSIMVKLIQLTNFNHILDKNQKQKQVSTNDVKLDEIDELTDKIISLNKQQIQLHQKYQIKERQTDNKILKMKQKIHLYCVLQCLVALASSALYVYFLNKYLYDNCLI